MKGKPQVVEMLNEVLVGELTAINQYFLAAKIAGHQGYEHLAHRVYDESVGEMKHAARLIERILYLDGLPNVQKLEKVKVSESVTDQLTADLEIERRSVDRLNTGIKLARDQGDNGTAELLEELLTGAERHVEWLETQVGLVKELGREQYLAQQVRG